MTQPIPETGPDYDRTRIIERPDGFYWMAKHDGRDYGPFGTLLEAVFDMELADESFRAPVEEDERPRLQEH
jgi:hypothetical protein